MGVVVVIECLHIQTPGIQIDAAVESMLVARPKGRAIMTSERMGRTGARFVVGRRSDLKDPRLGHGSHCDPAIQLGAVSTHPSKAMYSIQVLHQTPCKAGPQVS